MDFTQAEIAKAIVELTRQVAMWRGFALTDACPHSRERAAKQYDLHLKRLNELKAMVIA